ncbi:hypothetical protein A7982_13939 [Minicystis rosea]|nr:hypothetical protein A7982_13939 [Minicystis rosea]
MSRVRLLALASLTFVACTKASVPAASAPTSAGAPATSVAAPPPPLPQEGRIADEDVARVVAENAPATRQCYERALARDLTLEGAVSARLSVNRDGAVTAVEDVGSTLADAEAVRCVLDVAAKLRFPPPGGEKATVTVPFSFSTGATGEIKGMAHGCRVRESHREGALVNVVVCKTRIVGVSDSAGEASAVGPSLCDKSAGETFKCGKPLIGGKRCWDLVGVEEGKWVRTLVTSPAPGRVRNIACTDLASAAPSAWCNAMIDSLARGKGALEALQAVGP